MVIVYAVRHVMSKPLITADENISANEGIRLMVEKDIGSLVITATGKPVGIVTDRDVVRKCCGKSSCESTKLSQIMSKPLISIDADAPIGVAVEVMIKKNIRRLVVTDKKDIVGMVTQKDLLNGTLEAFQALHSIGSMM
jgi:CBS domain-containing protein